MKEVNGIKDIDFAFILEYVKEQGPDAIQWLKDLKNKPVKPDKGSAKYPLLKSAKSLLSSIFPSGPPRKRRKSRPCGSR